MAEIIPIDGQQDNTCARGHPKVTGMPWETEVVFRLGDTIDFDRQLVNNIKHSIPCMCVGGCVRERER